jgi:WD40 repeat protein
MFRRFFGPVIAGALAVGVSACNNTDGNSSSSDAGGDAPSTTAKVDIGGPLYPPVEAPARPATAVSPVEPVIVRQCQVSLSETQNVPSKNSGRLLYYCTEIKPGEVVPPELVIIHPRTKEKFRKLNEGDYIQKDQLVGFLDDKLAAANLATEEAAIKANTAKVEASEQIKEASMAEWKMYYELEKSNAGAKQETRRAKAQYDKSVADVADAKGQLLKSEEDKNKAKVILDEHEIRSTIPGKINRFYRKPGEAVKELEPVAEVQLLNKIRVEGLMEIQYLDQIEALRASGRAVKVFVEKAPQIRAEQMLIGHNQPVTGVAVSKDKRIVSVSEDQTARIWDRVKLQTAVMPHPVPVRAVACSPAGAEGNLCLTGADDGIPRVWDLDNPEPAKSVREFKVRHQSRILAVAFAPDGRTCATADEREICLWDTASGDLKYRFPGQHRGQITYLQFTPQSKLLSVARDHSMVLWQLGEKGATVDKVINYRSGDVPVLGVSPDGQSVLFDKERSLNVISVSDQNQRTEAVLQAPTEASRFAGFALFSPDGKMVLTAGTADNPLQLWRLPTNDIRGHLIRRMAVGPMSTPNCAAFAADGSFAVTGTQDQNVLVWKLPTEAEVKQQLVGALTFTSSAMDAADRKVRVWAELSNPQKEPLLAGETVTLVIPVAEQK